MKPLTHTQPLPQKLVSLYYGNHEQVLHTANCAFYPRPHSLRRLHPHPHPKPSIFRVLLTKSRNTHTRTQHSVFRTVRCQPNFFLFPLFHFKHSITFFLIFRFIHSHCSFAFFHFSPHLNFFLYVYNIYGLIHNVDV